jgi:hypothetical protein
MIKVPLLDIEQAIRVDHNLQDLEYESIWAML